MELKFRSFSATLERCATCDRWAGERKLSTWKDSVETAGSDVSGECVGGGSNRFNTCVDGSCSQWVKWSLTR